MFVLVGTVPRLFETDNLLPAFSVPVTEVEVGLATGTVVVSSVSAKEAVVSDVIEVVGVDTVGLT